MRKFLFFPVTLVITLIIVLFIGSLYIPETFNRQSLSFTDRFQCIFNATKIEKDSIESYIIKRKSAVIQEQKENNLKLLDGDAHQYALSEFCKKSGGQLTVDEESGLMTCDFTQESCENLSNLVTTQDGDGNTVYDIAQSKYFEWHNGKCVSTFPAAKSLCDFKFNLAYDKGDISCDSDKFGKCTVNRSPTCNISSNYCKSMGLEYESSNGLGDCYNPVWQEILENIVGQTIVRKYKESINNIINQCKNDPFGADCAKAALLNYPLTLSTVLKDTAFEFFPERWKELTDTCGGIDGSSESIINCGLAYLKFDPVSYMAITFVKVLSQLICNQLAGVDTTGIVGESCDLGGKAIKGILYATDKALGYLIKFPTFGKVIVESFAQLGDILGDSFEEIKDKMIEMFDGIDNFVNSIPGFIDNISSVPELHPLSLCARAILYGSVDVTLTFIDLFEERKINDIIQYSSIITNAFEEGGEELGKFVTTTLITGGLDALSESGELFVTAYGESATFFINASLETAKGFENLGGELQIVGENIGSIALETVGNVGDAVTGGAEAIGSFITNPVSSCCIC